MGLDNKMHYVSVGMVGITLLTGTMLATISVDANDLIDNTEITVPVSCSMTGSGMDTHEDDVANGTYLTDIGATTLHVFCNDAEGFAIYSVGFTDDIYGKNVLTDVVLGSTYDIVSGIATSAGDTDVSNWAMKLTITQDSGETTGLNAFTIDSAPNDDGGADVSFNQYHTVPTEYTKVAHKESSTDMTATVGGVKLNTTYATYISKNQPAGTYSGQVKFVLLHPSSHAAPDSLYGETLQTVPRWGDGVSLGQTVVVPDERDGELYTVARLADGRLWTTKNLRLNLESAYENITAENTNNPTQAFLDQLATNYAPTNTENWAYLDYDGSAPGSYRATIRYNNQDIGNTTVDSWGHSYDEYGIYYNWYTATAGNGSYDRVYKDGVVEGDLCPKHWHLPSGHNPGDSVTSGEYGKLAIALGASYYDNEKTGTYYSDSTPTGFEVADLFRATPNNFVMARQYYDGQLNTYSQTEYWTSLAMPSNFYVYTLGLSNRAFNASWAGSYHSYGYKYSGHAMRCVAD